MIAALTHVRDRVEHRLLRRDAGADTSTTCPATEHNRAIRW